MGLLKGKREKLGHIQNSIRDKQEELDRLQQSVLTVSLKDRATVLARDIDKLREADDVYWCQRGKTNLIRVLQDEAGVWERDMVNIHTLATRFYSTLFTSQTGGNLTFSGHLISSHLEEDALLQMDYGFTKEEVKKCLFTMNESKASGPDGMSARFFHIIGLLWGICYVIWY
ncbi:hypothetical protein LIER_34004 [Lithospermum erythrorhizon]|uniref:Uncharacterized protein n=1 Tax=Lithospermum erythrorhizon TaxID=34254 RepID=A0AAV3S3G8_LITER